MCKNVQIHRNTLKIYLGQILLRQSIPHHLMIWNPPLYRCQKVQKLTLFFLIKQKLVDPLTFKMIMSDVEEPSKIKTWYEEFKKCIKTWYEEIKNCFVSTCCFKKSAEFFAKVKTWFQEFKNFCASTRCYKKVKEIFTSETKKEDEIR